MHINIFFTSYFKPSPVNHLKKIIRYFIQRILNYVLSVNTCLVKVRFDKRKHEFDWFSKLFQNSSNNTLENDEQSNTICTFYSSDY